VWPWWRHSLPPVAVRAAHWQPTLRSARYDSSDLTPRVPENVWRGMKRMQNHNADVAAYKGPRITKLRNEPCGNHEARLGILRQNAPRIPRRCLSLHRYSEIRNRRCSFRVKCHASQSNHYLLASAGANNLGVPETRYMPRLACLQRVQLAFAHKLCAILDTRYSTNMIVLADEQRAAPE
jgi:hypothetical protein